MMVEAQAEGYRLSRQQHRLAGLSRAPGTALLRMSVPGDSDPARLRAALAAAVARHEILASRFVSAGGLELQVPAHPSDLLRWSEVDLTGADEERIRQCVAEQGAEPIPANGDPAVRAVAVLLGPDRRELVLTVPARAADAVSLLILADEVRCLSTNAEVDDDVLQYAQYAQWQYELFGEPTPDPAPAVGSAPSTVLPLQRTAPARTSTVRSTAIADGLRSAVVRWAREQGTDERAVLLTAFRMLLAIIGGQPAVSVAALLDGRGIEDVRRCVGPFERWMPLEGAPRSVHETTEILAEFESSFDTEREGRGAGIGAGEFRFGYLRLPERRDGFVVRHVDVDAGPCLLRLDCLSTGEGATLVWRSHDGAFEPRYLADLADQYATVLATLISNSAHGECAEPRAAAALSPVARERLVRAFNATDRPRARACLHELVAKQATATPEADAVICGSGSLSYRELEDRAEAAARGMRTLGVGPGGTAAVRLPHTADLVVALLAVLKTGACFVPVEPTLPEGRVLTMLASVGCRILISDRRQGAEDAIEPWTLAELVERGREGGDQPAADADDGDPAYIMFTSGSTGEPKGVVIPHRAIVNYLTWARDAYRPADGAVDALLHSSIAFDLTLTSVFVPLLAGAAVVTEPSYRDVGRLSEALADRTRTGLFKATPSHLAVLNQAFAGAPAQPEVGTLVIGGEALTADLIRPWLSRPGTLAVNEYGPTEAAVGCCVFGLGGDGPRAESPLLDGPLLNGPVPIGRPIDNTRIYVLDQSMAPVPVGVAGEIHIGGLALALGYARAAALTAERFVPDPFSGEPGARLYRTGDLACHGPDGELRYLGRRDEQIKIRGMRVEPNEIAAAVRACPGVRDAVVTLRADGASDLLAAYVVAGASNIDQAALRSHLADRLPAHMIPEAFVWVDSIPLTGNGKVDWKALPAPRRDAAVAGDPPVGPTESAVAAVVAELLGLPSVDRDSSFFDLGGHSLLAVRLVARLNAVLAADLNITDVAGSAAPSVAYLAALIDQQRGGGPQALIRLRDAGGGIPLFCVPAAGTDIVSLRELAAALGDARPVHGWQAPPAAEFDPALGVEAAAARLVEALRAAWPQGPYHLLGWSFGGLLAFEAARQLAAAGHAVPTLVLVDAHLSDADGRDQAGEPPAEAELLAAELAALTGAPPPARGASSAAGSEPDVAEVLAAAAEALGLRPDDAEHRHLLNLFALYHAQMAAAARYRPGRYAGPVHLVLPETGDAAKSGAAVAAWRAVCEQEPELTRLPGDHFSLLRAPAVGALARLVNRVSKGSSCST